MQCPKCQSELNEDSRFCSYCGTMIDHPSKDGVTEKSNIENSGQQATGSQIKPATKEKIKDYWNKRSPFGKTATISLLIFGLLCLIAFNASRILAGIFALLAIAMVVVAVLMKRQIIKVSKPWLPMAALVLSFGVVLPYFSLFSISLDDFGKYNWERVVLDEMLPQPVSPYGTIGSNTEYYLSMSITEMTEEQYAEYLAACKDAGFTIEAEEDTNSFSAFNDKGYKLSLNYVDYSQKMNIMLDAPMEMETISWPNSAIVELLPAPNSTTGVIYSDEEERFAAYIGNTTLEDYNTYVQTCEEKGFTINKQKQEKHFSAQNAEDYKLTVNYEGNRVIYIAIEEPVYDVTIEVNCEENWIFSKYNVKLSLDGHYEDMIPHGDTKTFNFALKRGKHTISFESADDSSLNGEVEVKITKNETIKIQISCSMFGVDVELISGTEATDDPPATTPSQPNSTPPTTQSATTENNKIGTNAASETYAGEGYKNVKSEFENLGFTNVTIYEMKTTDSTYQDGAVSYVTIAGSSFNKGEKFDKNAEVSIYYWKVEIIASEYEKAFARYLGSYALYYMFDTDTKKVVYFGTNDTYPEYGTYTGSFNSGVTISWDHGEWKDKFINKTGSSNAVLVDPYGSEWEYYICDVNEAQQILNSFN